MKTLIWILIALFPLKSAFAGETEESEITAEIADTSEVSPDVHPKDMGRSYFDIDQSIVKEVYSFKEVQRFNPNKPEEGVQIEEVKDGAYFRYLRNGQLEVSGTYSDGKKHGKFRYYDKDGKETHTVEFIEGEEQ